MMKEKNFDYEQFFKTFHNKNDINQIDKLGHLVGIHIQSSKFIRKLDYEKQKFEYEKCISLISKFLGKSTNEVKYMFTHVVITRYFKNFKRIRYRIRFKQTMTIEPEKGMKKLIIQI